MHSLSNWKKNLCMWWPIWAAKQDLHAWMSNPSNLERLPNTRSMNSSKWSKNLTCIWIGCEFAPITFTPSPQVSHCLLNLTTNSCWIGMGYVEKYEKRARFQNFFSRLQIYYYDFSKAQDGMTQWNKSSKTPTEPEQNRSRKSWSWNILFRRSRRRWRWC